MMVLLGVYIGGVTASILQRWITSFVLFGCPVHPEASNRDLMAAFVVSVTWPVSLPVILYKLSHDNRDS